MDKLKEVKKPEPTVLQKYKQDANAFAQRFQQLTQAMDMCKVEMIKTEGKIEGYKQAKEEGEKSNGTGARK